jgi:hypothetical protein
MSPPLLFQPIALRGVTAKNRILISPMCQYSAIDGLASDWHLVHLGKFAQGGAGIVMTEAAAVTAEGRITHGDLGLWHDGQVAPLERIATFLQDNGAVPAIQLAHAGRKASMQRPWYGNAALTADDHARGDLPWRTVAPSAIALDEGWLTPDALDADELESLREQWRLATLRAVDAGFELLEVHCAHGYLLHEFLSPLSNRRSDHYGGSFENRTRLLLEVVAAVRSEWPEKLPLFVRISSSSAVRCSRIRTGRCMRRRPCAQGSSGPCSTSARTSTRNRSMDLRLSGKTALVAGASSVGIGRVIAIGLAEEGVRVAITARRAHLLDEIAKHGVTVNCIQPGRISSEQMLRMYPTEEKRRAFTQEVPIARFGEPQELSELTIFLCSPRASYITGTVIPVDGGLSRFAF